MNKIVILTVIFICGSLNFFLNLVVVYEWQFIADYMKQKFIWFLVIRYKKRLKLDLNGLSWIEHSFSISSRDRPKY